MKRVSSGRLGCSLDDQPYVVPVGFSYEPDYIYIFSTLGKKIKWMRRNPKVCRLLENIKRIPGTDDTGKIDEKALRAWVKEAQSLCLQYGRADIGDQKIGQLLSTPVTGADGIWPCEQVRNVLEECGTSDIATGVQIGVYNSRGVHARGEGGEQERALAEKYRNWSRKLAFEYPYVANVVEGIAQGYDRQAEMQDSEAAVRRRLRH